jgi:glycosyltransferase involved in cell wall biosynthesis
MGPLLEGISQHTQVTVLRNPANLGFVASVNRGMSHLPDHDPVLLNSDTEVPPGWLQRMQQCAYSAADIGTVTPFSNNATICSYPAFCSDNSLPRGFTSAQLDALFQRANPGVSVDIPTAVGFCMYIRRDCLNATGLFDEANFGRGYGEENDFSMRAAGRGWRNVLCCNTFVFHAGAVSFAGERSERSRIAYEVLCKLHPSYPARVSLHIENDLARPFRLRIDLLRLRENGRPVVLFVSHDLGGGTARHIMELAKLKENEADFLLLSPGFSGQVELTWLQTGEAFRLYCRLPDNYQALIECLKVAGVQRVHFHHLLHHHDVVRSIPSSLGVPYDFTTHDFYMLCPQINLIDGKGQYCGEPPADACNRCLAGNPASQRDIGSWRQNMGAWLSLADRVLSPSQDTANRFVRHLPGLRPIVAPHPEFVDAESPVAPPMDPGGVLRVAVIGGLSAMKGSEVLEACALDAKARQLPLEFRLIGSAWRNLATEPHGALMVGGSYKEEELQTLLKAYSPHLVWFPAQWPETFSYTLSAALQAGLPVVAPDIGAFPERLARRPWCWIQPWNTSAREWNQFFTHIMEQHFLTNLPPGAPGTGESRQEFCWDDYLTPASLPRSDVDLATIAGIVSAHGYPDLTTLQAALLPIRRALLRGGITLRQHPWLKPIAKLIPSGLQYRIRDFLAGR